MTDLIEDLLMYSKSTSSVDSFQEVDLNEVVEEIALLHKEEFELKQVRMEVQALPTLWGVPFQFKQLMANLINNAIKYKHPQRQLIITIRKEATSVGQEIKEKDMEADQLYHHITVRDNGIGFEAQYAEKIFEIFQRLTNHSGTKGSGIGLAICKKIVQNHRGFIKATGSVNEGAKFDIYLPAGR
jgi:signal transduction histidine kinase